MKKRGDRIKFDDVDRNIIGRDIHRIHASKAGGLALDIMSDLTPQIDMIPPNRLAGYLDGYPCAALANPDVHATNLAYKLRDIVLPYMMREIESHLELERNNWPGYDNSN